MIFTEFELLTIREALFKCKNAELFTEAEFQGIDRKIKEELEART